MNATTRIEPTPEEQRDLENILDALMRYHVSAETVRHGVLYQIIMTHPALEDPLSVAESRYPERIIIAAGRVLDWLKGTLQVHPSAREAVDAILEYEGIR